MADSGPSAAASDTPEAQRERSTGAWAGYLIFALFLMVLIFLDARAAYNHEWPNVTGVTVFTLFFVTVPTGGAKLLRRSLRARKARRD